MIQVPDTIPVVVETEAKDEARAMGRDRFEGVEVENFENFDLGPFQSSAEYANSVLPRLRAMAGYGDAGRGTYQVDRPIAVIETGFEDDTPALAEIDTTAAHLYDELVEEWSTGAYEAAREAAGE